jgi:hypothetical protein
MKKSNKTIFRYSFNTCFNNSKRRKILSYNKDIFITRSFEWIISISVFLCLYKEETDIENYNLMNNLTIKSDF